MTQFLTLDLGTTTGWAAGGLHLTFHSGTQSFKPGRYDGGGMRYLRFTKWLNELHDAVGIERLGFEEVRRHLGVDAAHVYGGFLAHLTAWCELNKIPYEGIPVGTWKKALGLKGGGAAKKDVVFAEMLMRGHRPKDDNESDALGMLYWMLDQYGTTSPAVHRLAPHSVPKRRLPLVIVRLVKRPVSY